MELLQVKLSKLYPDHPFSKDEYSLGCLAHIINLAVNKYMDELKAPPPAEDTHMYFVHLSANARSEVFTTMSADFRGLLDKVIEFECNLIPMLHTKLLSFINFD